MRKIILSIIFLLSLFLSSSETRKVLALGSGDVSTKIESPSITPPDYTKGECPICDPGYNWMGDKGCCKIDVQASSSNVDFKFDCKQPNIVICKERFFCNPGIGCMHGGQVGKFQPVQLCSKLKISSEQSKCTSCMNDGKHVWTGLGCLPSEFGPLISSYIFSLFIGLGGGLSFLMFIYGSFLVLTSSGDVERVTAGKKYVMSAIKGLLLIIFAVFILRFLGVTLFRIPGFG